MIQSIVFFSVVTAINMVDMVDMVDGRVSYMQDTIFRHLPFNFESEESMN